MRREYSGVGPLERSAVVRPSFARCEWADFLDFFDGADLARAVPIMSTDEFIRKPQQCRAY